MVLAGNYLKPALVQEAGYDLLKIIIIIFLFQNTCLFEAPEYECCACIGNFFFFLFLIFSLDLECCGLVSLWAVSGSWKCGWEYSGVECGKPGVHREVFSVAP